MIKAIALICFIIVFPWLFMCYILWKYEPPKYPDKGRVSPK